MNDWLSRRDARGLSNMDFGGWKSFIIKGLGMSESNDSLDNSSDSLIYTVYKIANDEKWGASPTEMNKLVEHLNDGGASRQQILKAIRERWSLSSDNRDYKIKHWRRIYKALILYEHLILHGPKEHVLGLFVEDESALIQLENFLLPLLDSEPKDLGQSVRVKAFSIRKMLSDPDLLETLRLEARDRYQVMQRRKDTSSKSNTYNVSKSENKKSFQNTERIHDSDNNYRMTNGDSDNILEPTINIPDCLTSNHEDDDFDEFQSAATNEISTDKTRNFSNDLDFSETSEEISAHLDASLHLESKLNSDNPKDISPALSKVSLAEYLEVHKHLLDI